MRVVLALRAGEAKQRAHNVIRHVRCPHCGTSGAHRAIQMHLGAQETGPWAYAFRCIILGGFRKRILISVRHLDQNMCWLVLVSRSLL